MLIVLALVFGAIGGTAVHFALPQRALRGVAVGPLLGASFGTATWTALTWAGLGPDAGWIWLASILLPIVLTAAALTLVSRSRASRDARTRRELGIA
ncbi:hypothetical protein [Microbacterium oleivorans]|uniref:hypothetical protein n=1 Tax=Microbacterium oleivorans TaxID=273677 RepID=UPI00203FCC18|nr:hypothetical protein [Microbacterium oleivorans]MCM3696261.1 hypothetical protein [Microbacterium oleivorans]